jgi:peptidoglycan/LPS O-acetylase OafA/YrhL
VSLVLGFRGIAVLLLVASQLWLVERIDLSRWKPLDAVFTSGNLAVEMLLTGTGFVVTRRLLEARARAGVRGVLRAVFVRLGRIGVLVALVVAAVLVVAGVDGTDPTPSAVTRSTVEQVATFSLNSYIAGHPLSVRADLTSLWYVSVEAQLVLLLMVLVALLGARRRLLLGLLALLAVAELGWRWLVLDQHGWFQASLRVDARAIGFLLGALAAVVVSGRRPATPSDPWAGAALLLLGGLLVAGSWRSVQDSFGVFGAAVAVAGALFLGGSQHAADRGALVHAVVGTDWLVQLGRSWLTVLVWVGPVLVTVSRHTQDSEGFTRVFVALGVLALVVYLTDRVVAPALGAGWRAVREARGVPTSRASS